MKAVKLVWGSLALFTYTTCFFSPSPHCAITNDITGSPYARLGDQMVRYCKAKWLAYKYNIEFFLTSFPHSDQFAFSKIEKNIQDLDKKKFKKEVFIKRENDLMSYLKKNKEDTLFSVGLHTGINDEDKSDCLSLAPLYSLSRKNKVFETEIKMLLQPFVQIPQINMPDGMITVAVHVRKGGGFDVPLSSEQYFDGNELFEVYKIIDLDSNGQRLKTAEKPGKVICKGWRKRPSDRIWPMRFPPEQYYVDQIKRLSALLCDAPLYVYIFTDDSKPQEILERLKRTVNKQNIIFATRCGENVYGDHAIEDMFAMAQFDCLIRSLSDYAFIPQLIGSHKIIFFPLHKRWISEKKLFIDKVGIFLNKPQSNDPKAKLFDAILADSQSYPRV
jgi:hypothetical protein